MRRVFAAGLIFLFFYSLNSLYSQDGSSQTDVTDEDLIIDEADELDSLFDEPQEDIIVEAKEEEPDLREAFEVNDKVVVSGNFTSTGAIGVGWNTWDFLTDVTQGFDGFAGLTSTASVTFDARPSPEFRVYGNIYAAYNPVEDENVIEELEDILNSTSLTTGSWAGPSISELYCDYILYDFLYSPHRQA